MKKGLFRIMLLVTTLCLFLCACASSVEEEIFDTDFLGTASGTDLEGYEYTYGTGTALSDNVLGYEPDTMFADLVLQRIKKIEKDMNCTITVKDFPDFPHAIVTASASGSYLADTFNTVSDMIAEVARLDMLYGMSSLTDHLDYHDEQKWGYRYMLEVVYYEDDLYGICPMMWPELIPRSCQYVLVVNEDIIRELAQTDPRDYVENGTWTWEQFRKALGDYYVEEGGQVKYYSLTANPSDFGLMFIRTNGDKFVKKEANGTYSLGFYSKTALDAMEEGKSIFNDYGYAITSHDIEKLIGGTAVMGNFSFHEVIGITGRISKEMNNYGLLSWPVGPAVDPSYKFSTHSNIEGNCIGFSKMAKDIDATAIIVEQLYEPFEDYDTPEKIKEYVSHNYFYDPRDCDVYFDMANNAEYTYFHWGSLRDSTTNYMTSGKSVTETMESIRTKFEKETEEYIMPSIRGIIALWGDYQ